MRTSRCAPRDFSSLLFSRVTWRAQRRTALEQQSARIGLLVQHLEEADSAMKVRYIHNVTCSGWCASLYPSLTLLPLPFCFQEHADVSDSLGRRLREEAEVNAALSQVSAFQLSSVSSSSVSNQSTLVLPHSYPFFFPLRRSMQRRCNFWPKGQRTRCTSSARAFLQFCS